MVSLNTLRTRFGVVLSAVIAIALVAFIFSLKAEMGFLGDERVVAQINGHSVTVTEYQEEYNKIFNQSGLEQVTEAQAEMIYQSTWQALVMKYVLRDGIEKLGVEVSDAERMAVIRGEVPTQAMYSAFADPQHGNYNMAALNNFLITSVGNPQAEAVWEMLNEEACNERMLRKYGALVTLGVNVNKLEIAEGSSSNNNFSGRWAVKQYSEISDETVTVTESEIESYYKANKSSYERQPSRDITYVMFNVMPSTADLKVIDAQAESVRTEFARGTANIERYLRENRLGRVAEGYVAAAQLPAAEASAAAAGRVYGPSSDGVNMRISRAVANITAADSLTLRHIVLPYTETKLADSLQRALRTNAAAFATAAQRYSVFAETAQLGGEIGTLPFSAFSGEFAEALAPARRGDIVRVESGDMIQLLQVVKAGNRVRQYKMAVVEIPLVASTETLTKVHGQAGLFASQAKGGVKGFENAVQEAQITARQVVVTNASRTVPGLAGSSEIARWANRAKVGEMSEIFKVNDGYVVAVLAGVNNKKHHALSEVAEGIKSTLLRKKKYDYIASQISGTSFDDQAKSIGAEPKNFTDVIYDSYYINGMGVEPRVVGAITTSKKTGVASAPIEGNSGVYIYTVRAISGRMGGQNAKQVEDTRLETLRTMAQQMLFMSLESASDIVDKRGEVL